MERSVAKPIGFMLLWRAFTNFACSCSVLFTLMCAAIGGR
jgi:hypothetical protein